ncbi:hypothetical protein ACTJK4_22055, partial [Ralstonia sp. 22111]|uniref:hypothetical protein n=1 Tax=Ralstonia sp. 22111 TaxID=3453878 RepID=UPI003F8750DE
LCLLSLGKTKESESAPAGDETRDAPTTQNPENTVEGQRCCAIVTARVQHATLWDRHRPTLTHINAARTSQF